MQLGIADLETLFAKSKTDDKVLKQLEHELQHRKTPRAVTLLVDVRKNLNRRVHAIPTASAKPMGLTTSNHQLELHPPAQISATAAGSQSPIASVASPPPVSVTPASREPSLPPVSLDEACKILKVTLGTNWEAIEHNRRELVELAHPSRLALVSLDKRNRLSNDARRANAAYAAIAAFRCSVNAAHSDRPAE